MRLGELIAIMAAYPARMRIGQRKHRQLDYGGAVDQPVENPELEAMHDILGIVQHDGLYGSIMRGLVLDEGVVEMVEAIGLGRRPIGRHFYGLDAGIGDAGDGGRGRRIVAVESDENAIIVIIETLERRLEHRGDDRGFIPGRNQDRDESGVLVEDVVAGEGSRVTAVHSERAPRSTDEINEVDEQVVDGKNQEADARKKRQLRRETAEEFGNRHGAGLR